MKVLSECYEERVPEGTRGLFTALFTKDLGFFTEDSALLTKDPK